MAVLGPCVNVNMNGQSNIHSQLTKSLERILEDAYLSGELKLSGRKLREFPKPVKFDLSDTVVAGVVTEAFLAEAEATSFASADAEVNGGGCGGESGCGKNSSLCFIQLKNLKIKKKTAKSHLFSASSCIDPEDGSRPPTPDYAKLYDLGPAFDPEIQKKVHGFSELGSSHFLASSSRVEWDGTSLPSLSTSLIQRYQ
ncbi:hypothetical protein MSG28_002050 [Choristoneura fumiferana]|uniref:Uncharacterized protein n=1 Tax=Choristoneura fumiferana TaxID=7141 RepID=A0ACC0JU44_CHOFU|nr:hypothetical protein MSG28_002050 [Choristoneura fumiferana]